MTNRSMGLLLASGFAATTFACGDEPVLDEPPIDAPSSSSSSSGSSSSSSSSSASSSSSGSAPDAGEPDSGATDGAPTVVLTSPRDGVATGVRKVRVTGAAQDDVAIATLHYALGSAAPAPITAEANGSFAFDVTPEPGDNVLTVTAVDSAGQTRAVSTHVHYGHRLTVGNSQSALLHDGQLSTWGRNELGQLGNGTLNGTWSADENAVVPAKFTVAVPSPLVSVVTRQTFMLGLGTDGAVYSWGANKRSQLGRETPADCGSNGTEPCGKVPAVVPELTGAVAVEAGFEHALILRSDGTVLAFGSNAFGQLGPGEAGARRTPTVIAGLGDIVQVAACAQTSMALTRDGHVWVWGNNAEGQLGNGTKDTLRHPDPVQVAGIESAVAIAGANSTPMVLLADGTVRAWGENQNGQVGNGTQVASLTPVTVLAHGGAPLAGIESIAADGFVGLAVDRQGVTYTWGWGFLGQLGRGLLPNGDRNLETDALAAPVVVPSGAANLVAVEAEVGAGGPAFVRTADGSVYGWGWSFRGSLGGGSALLDAWAYTSPILVHPQP